MLSVIANYLLMFDSDANANIYDYMLSDTVLLQKCLNYLAHHQSLSDFDIKSCLQFLQIFLHPSKLFYAESFIALKGIEILQALMNSPKLNMGHRSLIVQVCTSICGFNLQITVDCFEWGMFEAIKSYFDLASDMLQIELSFWLISVV